MDVRAIQVALCAAGYPVSVDGDLGPKSYAALFAFVGRARLSPLITALGQAADKYFATTAIVTPLRLAHALAQWAVETRGYTRMEEDLDYSAQRLVEVWPKRFPSLSAATPYAHHPVAIANLVYGGRLGNVMVGDGWLYRGRGPTQLTGRANYLEAGKTAGLDLANHPDTVAEPDTGLRVACSFWTARNINAAADADDVTTVRRLVNGGAIGLPDAKRYLARAKLVIK